MTMAGVVEARFARINEALGACKVCIDQHNWADAGDYAMQAVNMAGQYGKECSDLADCIENRGRVGAIERLRENAELFYDLRGIGLAYYNECVEHSGLIDDRR